MGAPHSGRRPRACPVWRQGADCQTGRAWGGLLHHTWGDFTFILHVYKKNYLQNWVIIVLKWDKKNLKYWQYKGNMDSTNQEMVTSAKIKFDLQ